MGRKPVLRGVKKRILERKLASSLFEYLRRNAGYEMRTLALVMAGGQGTGSIR